MGSKKVVRIVEFLFGIMLAVVVIVATSCVSCKADEISPDDLIWINPIFADEISQEKIDETVELVKRDLDSFSEKNDALSGIPYDNDNQEIILNADMLSGKYTYEQMMLEMRNRAINRDDSGFYVRHDTTELASAPNKDEMVEWIFEDSRDYIIEGDYLRANVMSVSFIDYFEYSGNETYRGFYYCKVGGLETTAEQELVVDAKVDEILSSLELDGKSEIEKVIAIHDYVADTSRFSEMVSLGLTKEQEKELYPNVFSAYGVLVEGSGVCNGFAASMVRLYRQAGIYCKYIRSTTHAWNIVEIDGKFYNLDCSWDCDSDNELNNKFTHKWFLKANSDFEQSESHIGWDIFYTDEFNKKYPRSLENYPLVEVEYNLDTEITSAVVNNDNGTVDLEWKPAELGCTYQVWRRELTNDDKYKLIAELTENCYTDTLISSGEYRYIIRVKYKGKYKDSKSESIKYEGTINRCIVTFDACGGILDKENQVKSFVCDDTYGTLPNPVRDDFIFIGWFSEKESGTRVRETDLVINKESYTLYAHWGNKESTSIAEGSCGNGVFWKVNEDNILYITGNGETYDYDANDAPWQAYKPEISVVVVEKTVTRIGENAFNGCSSLQDVRIYDGLQEIGENAFKGCSALESITFPESLVSIADDAFCKNDGSKNTEIKVICTAGTEAEKHVLKCGYTHYFVKSSIRANVEKIIYTGTENIGEKIFEIASKDKYDLVTYSLLEADANENVGLDSDGTLVYMEKPGNISVCVNLKGNAHYLSDSLTAEVDVQYGSEYTVTFDANGGSILSGSPAKVVGPSNKIGVFEGVLQRDGYAFDGSWYTSDVYQIDSTKWDFDSDRVYRNMTLYAGWIKTENTNDGFGEILSEDQTLFDGNPSLVPEGLWVADVKPYEYTGNKVEPKDIRVYHGKKLLTRDADYKVKYKNNVKASDKAEVVVSGKGRYSGSVAKMFSITRRDLADARTEDVYFSYKEARQMGKPTVTYWLGEKKIKLVAGKDFRYVYPNDGRDGAYQEVGENHLIEMHGLGNYTGVISANEIITTKPLINKAIVKEVKNYLYWGGRPIPQNHMVVTLNGKTLTKDVDYTVSYLDNINPGKATVEITGIGEYSGKKTANFSIIGTEIKKALVEYNKNYEYVGSEIKPDCEEGFRVTYKDPTGKETELIKGTDYAVSYRNNKSAGEATMVIKGINGYTGSVKKSFKIEKRNLNSDTIVRNVVEEAEFELSGVKPKIMLTDTVSNRVLILGTDYNLSAKNNKKLSNDKLTATVTVKGKGNYNGSLQVSYRVVEGMISDSQVVADDAVYNSSKGKLNYAVKVVDNSGKELKRGRDYEVSDEVFYLEDTYIYEKDNDVLTLKKAGVRVDLEMDSIPETAFVYSFVSGKGNFDGEAKAIYRIRKKAQMIYSATVLDAATNKKVVREYTGREVTLNKSDLIVKISDKKLDDSEYEIIGYRHNIIPGTATMIIRGQAGTNGDVYCGIKYVKFKISARSFVRAVVGKLIDDNM